MKTCSRRQWLPRRCRAAGFALVLLAPMTGHAACKVTSLEMPVKIVGNRAIATVSINGTEVPLLVDSGAFYSSLTEAAAKQLDLPTSPMPRGMTVQGLAGDVDARMTVVKELKLLKGELRNIEFMVSGNETQHEGLGLMGRNLLSFADTEYDLAHGMVRFMSPNEDCSDTMMAYWAGSDTSVSQLRLKAKRFDPTAAIEATGQLNGVDTEIMFDTGARTLLSKAAALRAGIAAADMMPAAPIRGAGRGEVRGWTAPLQKFELGSELILNSRVGIGEFDLANIDMLLGIDFFLSHRIYVAKSQRRIYFTYVGGKVFGNAAAAAPQAGASAPASSLRQ